MEPGVEKISLAKVGTFCNPVLFIIEQLDFELSISLR